MRRNQQTKLYDPPVIQTLLFLLLCSSSEHLALQHNHTDSQLLDDVLKALDKTTAFFEQDYASVNVDGLFGIRLCQGSILETQKDCSSSNLHCPTALIQQLDHISSRLSQAADRAMPYVQDQDPKYYEQFLPTIDAPYIVQYVEETLGNVQESLAGEASYDEHKGDNCFSNLMGTLSDNGRVVPKCTITEMCMDYMTRRDVAAYAITHQILYLIIAEKNGCLHELEKLNSTVNGSHGVRDIERHLCGQIYLQSQREVHDGSVDVLKQDLFLEQIVLCGLLGFKDFVSRDWVRMILSWQNAVGCFSLPHQLFSIEEFLLHNTDQQRQLLDLLYTEAETIEQQSPGWRGRQLMREKAMDGDCLAHKTGLAIGTLGVYTRQLVRQVYGG